MLEPAPEITYLSQVFDRKADYVLVGFLVVFFITGIYLPHEGRWLLWGTALVIAAFLFGRPLVSKEKREARKASKAAWDAYDRYLDETYEQTHR